MISTKIHSIVLLINSILHSESTFSESIGAIFSLKERLSLLSIYGSYLVGARIAHADVRLQLPPDDEEGCDVVVLLKFETILCFTSIAND